MRPAGHPAGVTALIGGGGKTTLMYHLARELRERGTVAVTTTTKIWPPPASPWPNPDTAREILAGRPGVPGVSRRLRANWCPRALRAGTHWRTIPWWRRTAPPESPSRATKTRAGAAAPAQHHHSGAGSRRLRPSHQRCGTIVRPVCPAGRCAGKPTVTPAIAARVAAREGFHDQVFVNQVDQEEERPLARQLAERLDCPVAAGSLRSGCWEKIK